MTPTGRFKGHVLKTSMQAYIQEVDGLSFPLDRRVQHHNKASVSSMVRRSYMFQ